MTASMLEKTGLQHVDNCSPDATAKDLHTQRRQLGLMRLQRSLRPGAPEFATYK
jgi:hypothetical protein